MTYGIRTDASGNFAAITSGTTDVFTFGPNASNANTLVKMDTSSPMFVKTGANTLSIKAGTVIGNGYVEKRYLVDTALPMPTLAAGTDYAGWLQPNGIISWTSGANYNVSPVANSRKIGGFHYGLVASGTTVAGGSFNAAGSPTTGGMVWTQGDVDKIAGINEFSLWDLKFRPACSDPRGMVLVNGRTWVDIYLTGVDAITNGSSKYNVAMADGSSPPKVPIMFGGNGTTNYGTYSWFEAMELATAFGKRCPNQQEFMSATYGTTEASSIGTDQVSTILNAAYTSKWGVVQATGVLWVWGSDRGGPFASAAWNANTEGRGSEYNAPNAAIFGGDWYSTSNSGSRCSRWDNAASTSGSYIGSRFVSDHLQLD